MALTDLAAKKAKPRDKDYKLSVERGLYLHVKTSGAKYWRMKYRFAGKEKTLSFGVYPEVTLAEAMERLDVARRQLRDDTDPGLEKKKAKLKRNIENLTTFESVARAWIEMKARKCFICGAVGCIAKTCTKRKETVKALAGGGPNVPARG